MDSIRGGEFGLTNTNRLIRFYPGATGLKTGYTDSAHYCMSATAERDGMELIAVVMKAPTTAQRFEDAKTLLDHGFANYALFSPDLCDVASVPVKLGKTDSIRPRMGEAASLLIDKGKKGAVTTEAVLEEVLTAPVRQGQPIGTLVVKADGQILKEIPLVAAEDVERLSFGDLFSHVLRRAAMART